MDKQTILKNLLNKKKSKTVLTGKSFEIDYNKRIKLENLKRVQSNLVDKCLEKNNWSEWFKLQDTIETLESELRRGILWEIMIYEMYRLQQNYKTTWLL